MVRRVLRGYRNVELCRVESFSVWRSASNDFPSETFASLYLCYVYLFNYGEPVIFRLFLLGAIWSAA